ncbi:MAG: hypothetical protein ACR2LT_09235 [Pyrinomonadaceae bacterium]
MNSTVKIVPVAKIIRSTETVIILAAAVGAFVFARKGEPLVSDLEL